MGGSPPQQAMAIHLNILSDFWGPPLLIVEIMQRNVEISEHHMVVTFCTRLLQIKRDASYRADAEIMAAFSFDHMGNAMVEKITEKVAG
jgi:hypothetical protein